MALWIVSARFFSCQATSSEHQRTFFFFLRVEKKCEGLPVPNRGNQMTTVCWLQEIPSSSFFHHPFFLLQTFQFISYTSASFISDWKPASLHNLIACFLHHLVSLFNLLHIEFPTKSNFFHSFATQTLKTATGGESPRKLREQLIEQSWPKVLVNIFVLYMWHISLEGGPERPSGQGRLMKKIPLWVSAGNTFVTHGQVFRASRKWTWSHFLSMVKIHAQRGTSSFIFP